MNKIKYLIISFTVCFFVCSAYAQKICAKESIIGQWRQAETIPGVFTNTDSLKTLAAQSKKTIGTLNINADGTYRYRFLDMAAQKSRPYTLDTLNCEIILGTKRNARQKSNLTIIYVDHQFLFFSEDNNPKGLVTHLNVRADADDKH